MVDLILAVLSHWFILVVGFVIGCFWAGRPRDDEDQEPPAYRLRHGQVIVRTPANDVGEVTLRRLDR